MTEHTLVSCPDPFSWHETRHTYLGLELVQLPAACSRNSTTQPRCGKRSRVPGPANIIQTCITNYSLRKCKLKSAITYELAFTFCKTHTNLREPQLVLVQEFGVHRIHVAHDDGDDQSKKKVRHSILTPRLSDLTITFNSNPTTIATFD